MVKIYRTVNDYLSGFSKCFKQTRIFHQFILVIMGMLSRQDTLGVTSFVRCLKLHESWYDVLIRFFRSPCVLLKEIYKALTSLLNKTGFVVKVKGYVVGIGDGTLIQKSGTRMPGVTRQKKTATRGRSEYYFFGQNWSSIAICLESQGHYLAAPVIATLATGLKGLGLWLDSHKDELAEFVDYIAEHIVNQHEMIVLQAHLIARRAGPFMLTLDRFYLTNRLLDLNAELNAKFCNDVHVIVRCKMNVVGYRLPQDPGRKPSKSWVYRDQLSDHFRNMSSFQTTTVFIYGHTETIDYKTVDLLWGNHLQHRIRFVLTVQSNGRKSIFACTNLSFSAEDIIEIYALRFKIELGFRTFKQDFDGFSAHFWSKVLSVLDWYAKQGAPDRLAAITSVADQKRILLALKAHEVFAACACVAMALSQIIALTPAFTSTVQKCRWLRTMTPGVVSEATVRYYFCNNIGRLLASDRNSLVSSVTFRARKPHGKAA